MVSDPSKTNSSTSESELVFSVALIQEGTSDESDIL